MSNYEPQVYVACLAAYNAGYLHGIWIDATQSVDEIWIEINKMLSKSPIADAEEFEIQDYSDFGSLIIEPYTDIETINSLAIFVKEYGQLGVQILECRGGNIEDAMTYIEDCYHGEFNSEKEFAEYIANETWEIPEYLVNYIDYESVAHDLFINDYFSLDVDGKVHVFSYY